MFWNLANVVFSLWNSGAGKTGKKNISAVLCLYVSDPQLNESLSVVFVRDG